MYLCPRNYDLSRGGTFETAKAGTFHSVTAGTLIPLSAIFAPRKERDMCQTSVITNRVERLSKRSYSHRLDVATPNRYHVTQLVRLNRELDSLYEFIYDDWRTITEEDYKMFGGQFVILIQTIKQLYDACKKQPKAMGLGEETKRLGMNYSALYELNSDIVNFCIKMPKNEEMKKALQHLAEVDKRLDGISKA